MQLPTTFARLQPVSIAFIAHIDLPLLRRTALRLQQVFNTVVAATAKASKLLRNGFVPLLNFQWVVSSRFLDKQDEGRSCIA
ncbi:hypothetical protein, partial [Paraburkholderia sp. UYCP14C]|uniref:hypothetical protein n=1 Tax=Paraburkholderia sp. UYCP14C TaxID=2511130 RepID=UPI001B7D5A59